MKNIRISVFVIFVGLFIIASTSGCKGLSQPQPTQPGQTQATTAPVTKTATGTSQTTAPTGGVTTPTSVPTLLAGILSNKSNVAPQMVGRSPAAGEEMPLDSSLLLTFDQAMDPKTGTGALTITGPDQQPVAGKVSWSDPRTLVFKPDQPLKSSSAYTLVLSTQASSAAGMTLKEPVSFSFTTVNDLQVSQVFPADLAIDVENKALVTVMFNRPVVPLVIAEDQSRLPTPITIDPEISGTGQWLNTSVYIFRPTSFLKGGVNYKVTVKSGLADAAGSKLAKDYSWTFKTQSPSITDFLEGDNVDPQENLSGVILKPTFTIDFAQAMDTSSVQNGLVLMTSAGRKPLSLSYQWDQAGTQIIFKPTQQLELNTAYTLSVPASVQSVDGGALKSGLQWDFTTVMPPGIASAGLATGKGGPSNAFQIQFNSPIDFKSLADKIVFSPALDKTTSQWYDENQWTLYYYDLAASTTYTVQILPGIQDPYGNTIQTSKTVTVTTPPSLPSASLAMPYEPVYRLGGTQQFYVSYTNITHLDASLYHLTTPQFFAMQQDYQQQINYSGPSQDLIWHYQQNISSSKDKSVQLPLTMTQQNGKPLDPGFYFLGMNANPVARGQNSNFLDFRFLMVTSDNITIKNAGGEVLAWLTDLTSGAPSPNVPLKIYDAKFNVIAQGTTDKDGMLHVNVPVVGLGGDTGRFIMTDDPTHFGFADSNWGSGVSPTDFGIGEQYFQMPQNYSAYLYTDRPLYRPDQPVHFKGILRSEDDLSYKLPDQSKIQVTIDDFQNKVYQETLTLSSFGSFEGSFQLAKDTALGPYEIFVTYPNSDQQMGSVNFNVAEYRLPEFQVDVATTPKNVLPGDPITANVDANYYSGGGLSKAAVDWTLSSDAYSFTPPDKFSAYSFSDIDQDNVDYSLAGQQEGNQHKEIATGSGQTDDKGHFSLNLPAQLGSAKTSQQLTFEATLTDFAGTSVSARDTVVLNLAQVYPGIRSTSYVGLANKPATFDLAALDWDGKPIANQHVDVNIVERQWFSVQQEDANGVLQWKTTVKDIPVATFNDQALGSDGTGQISFTPDHGAIYKASITAKDSHGNAATASTFMWISGEAYIPWAQTNDRSFQVVLDKAIYSPGDTAQLLIASPFQGDVYALVTVERGRVRQANVTKLTSNSTVYSLPITADMAPNVYVSVVVVKGVDANNPRPNFKVGMAKVNVTTEKQALKVTVTPDKTQAGPGDKVTYAVQTTAMDGTPVKSEVSLALVDLAALSLSDPNSIPALDYFYEKRGLGVSTSIAIVQSIEDFNSNLSDHLTAQGKGAGSGGGGKGGGVNGVIPVRGNFPDTAYWQAQLDTDANGKASVTVTLPDNLTTWRMDARAVTMDTRLGQTTVDIVSSKPLLVRPQTPRFFVSGDQVQLGAAVHNNTSTDLQVTVNLDATGLNLSTDASQVVKIAANQQALVTWNASVPSGNDRVDLVFSASGGGYQDASRPTLGTLSNQGIPVFKYEAPETVGTSGMLSKEGTQVETISLPQSMTVTKGQLSVELSPSLAAGITDGLTYLKTYPYECNEQTVSSFLPNVRTEETLKAAGLSNPTLEANLKDQVSTALQKLYNGQNSDGGWGWWKGQTSDITTTAYVALGMVEAKSAGYTVTGSVMDRAISFLQGHLSHFGPYDPPEQLNRQAFVLYVLAQAGSPDVSQTVALYDLRQTMAFYARAYLLQTLHSIDAKDQRLPALISDLNTAAIQSATGTHWEEKSPDYLNWNTDTRSTAIILGALIETDANSALLPDAVRWLMSNRDSGYWKSTQETAWVLLAMSDWINKSGELKGNFQYAAAFNGKGLLDASANSSNIGQSHSLTIDVTDLLTQDINRLVLAHDSGSGNLYYTAHLNLDLPVDQIKALDRGIIISRQYFYPNDLKTPVTSAKPGDVLLARLTVVATNTLHNLLVTDPLPAGLEGIDTSLNSSPTNTMPDSFDWTRIGTDGWGWWFFSHVELRDEKVVLSTDELPAGTYTYTYQVRASTTGVFNTIPPTAQEVYFPEVYGRGDGSIFTVKP
ncbi:MAG: Ig-like domain-containing protein [Anaerolineaceae bacterium]|nr:Ig-like domain-containing protein [Anaerolineaceae bacterium]